MYRSNIAGPCPTDSCEFRNKIKLKLKKRRRHAYMVTVRKNRHRVDRLRLPCGHIQNKYNKMKKKDDFEMYHDAFMSSFLVVADKPFSEADSRVNWPDSCRNEAKQILQSIGTLASDTQCF